MSIPRWRLQGLTPHVLLFLACALHVADSQMPEPKNIWDPDYESWDKYDYGNLVDPTDIAPQPGDASKDLDCTCGVTNTRKRIVGGEESQVHEFPWLVALTVSKSHRPMCGGTIYNDEWVITAAHCVHRLNPRMLLRLRVLFNMYDWRQDSPEVRELTEIYIHPGFNQKRMHNDIALLHLKHPISLTGTPGIKPACLPPKSADYTGKNAIITGWGLLADKGKQPSVQNDVSVPIRMRAECEKKYTSLYMKNMICAGPEAGGKDSCQGDSGGPLTVPDNKGRHLLVGVVSWGIGCGKPGNYGVYVNVADYIDYINRIAHTGRKCKD